MEIQTDTLKPNQLRSRLEEIRGLLSEVETEVERIFRKKGEASAVALIDMRHELVEAAEAVDRAKDALDFNYRELQ